MIVFVLFCSMQIMKVIVLQFCFASPILRLATSYVVKSSTPLKEVGTLVRDRSD